MGNNFFVAGLFDLAVYGLVLLGIFLLLRALMLWYWKIDKIVGYLKIIADHFERIDNIESGGRSAAASGFKRNGSPFETCPKCGKESDKNFNICEHCGGFKQ